MVVKLIYFEILKALNCLIKSSFELRRECCFPVKLTIILKFSDSSLELGPSCSLLRKRGQLSVIASKLLAISSADFLRNTFHVASSLHLLVKLITKTLELLLAFSNTSKLALDVNQTESLDVYGDRVADKG